MLSNVMFLIIALAVLIWGADRFVTGASGLARRAGVSPLIIGMTIVALGTSAPEIVVAVLSALKGNPGLAIGGAIGSNIANVGLVLGLTALYRAIPVPASLIKREFNFLLICTIAVVLLFMDGSFTRIDGWILIALLVALMGISTYFALTRKKTEHHVQVDDSHISMPRSISWFIVGLIALPLSSEYVVTHATEIAKHLGVGDEIIGLTILALGTSLPELAASIVGTLKGEPALALGNVIGSNVFNILTVLPCAGILAPSKLKPEMLHYDLPALVASTMLIFLVSLNVGGKRSISRIEGGILFALYVGFMLLRIHL